MEAVGVVYDGLAAHPGHRDLKLLRNQVERQFVAQETPDTAAVVDKMTRAYNRAKANHDNVHHKPMKAATAYLKKAKAAFARAAPFCAQYEKIGFFNRKCKHCERKKAACEASRPAKARLDRNQAQYDKVSLSAEHFVYLLAISFGNFSPSRYYPVMRCKSGGRCAK